MSEMIADAFENLMRAYNTMPFPERVRFQKSVYYTDTWHCDSINWKGYVRTKSNFAIGRNEGEHYVYLWKHLGGDIFYVGRGEGDRWINKHRKDDFLKHIDKGDAVVYMVLYDVDKQTAMFYERYISGCLSEGGYPLVNKDNNVHKMGVEKFHEWCRDNSALLSNELTTLVEDVILNKIIPDKDFGYSEFVAIQNFRRMYGDTYFSDGGFSAYYKAGEI